MTENLEELWIPEDGAIFYENWLAQSMGAPEYEAFEYPLFSDSYMVGEIKGGMGPYIVLNGLPTPKRDLRTPVGYLRVQYHLNPPYRAMTETYTKRYHGGSIQDEVAALLSLTLGLRLRAGSATRFFQAGGDPRGQPWGFRNLGQENPIVHATGYGPVLPTFIKQHEFELAEPLKRFCELNQTQSVAVVRAARMYQQGVWIAESDPAQAWVSLVSAVETAAVYWKQSDDTASERLRASKPELALLLSASGGEALVSEVAEMIVPYLGSTKRFLDFLLTHFPSPPSQRPPEYAQHRWSKTAFRKTLNRIYGYRSSALHAGIPFPAPMCLPPFQHDEGYDEIGAGGGTAAGMGDHVWMAEDIPLMLHVFEYIVRNALLQWWGSLLDPRP